MNIAHLDCAEVTMEAALSLARLRTLTHRLDNADGWCGCQLESWFSADWQAEQSDPNLTKSTRVNGELTERAIRYRGSLPTRIAQFAHARGTDLPKEYLSDLGNLIKQELDLGQCWHLDFVDLSREQCIPWDAGDYGDSGSCYWSTHNSSQDMLCWYGAWAVRVYNNNNCGSGRAWLLPLLAGKLTTMPQAEGLLVWNGYLPSGHVDSETKTIARVLQKHLDAPALNRVGLSNGLEDPYINKSGGWFVGPAGAAPHDLALDWSYISWDKCCACGQIIGPISDDYRYCMACLDSLAECARCGNRYTKSAFDRGFCADCVLYAYCESCGVPVDGTARQWLNVHGDRVYVCEAAACQARIHPCGRCGRPIYDSHYCYWHP